MTNKTIQQIQDEIFEEFEIYSSWSEKYEYLVELGRELAPLPLEQKIEANKLQGCTSRVWLVCGIDFNQLFLQAQSDSLIMAGLLNLILRIYNGQAANDILSTKLDIFDRIGITNNLTSTRNNGLKLILDRISQVCLGAV